MFDLNILFKKILFFFACFLFLFKNDLVSQQAIVLHDSLLTMKAIGSEVFLYEDKTKSWTVEDAELHEGLFEKSSQMVPSFGVTKSTIWTRIILNNKSNVDFQIVMGYPNIDTAVLYYPTHSGYQQKVSGWSFPESERDVVAPDLIFTVPTMQKDTPLTYFLKSKGRIVILPLSIGKANVVQADQHKNSLYYLFYLGFVSMLFLYNLSIYFTSREREYLYYSTWVFFATLFFMIAKGYSSMLLPIQFNGILKHTNIVSSFGGISIILFVITTLRLKKYLPLFYKLFLILIGVYIIIIASSLLNNLQLASNLSQIALLITVVLGMIAGYYMYRKKGHTFAKFYFYGFVITLISMFIYIMIFQNVFGFNKFTNNAIVVGSVIEMILFSFGLGAKISSLNRDKQLAQESAILALSEKEQLVNQQKVLLETKVDERTHELKVEKKKSDDLLLNILPAEVAAELIESGSYEAKNYANVTVLFTDFVNFTGISEELSPKELVDELHIYFKNIDLIIEKYGLEKIKTIGDAYLAVSGLPIQRPDHAQKSILAALEILELVKARKNKGGLFDIRIGINSGPVIAGIVGIKKFAFDIWGDTVNTAARMEQNGISNKINISGSTFNLIRNDFHCNYRGKIDAKNKGEIDMYFVDGIYA